MRRKLAIALFFILVFSIIAIVARDKIGQRNTPVKTAPVATGNNRLSLPVAQRTESVLNTWIAYVFRAPIKEMKQLGEGSSNYSLILETDNKAIPTLFLSERTPVLRVVDNQQTPISLSELQVGTLVDVFASYNIDNNSWSVGRIIIPPELETQDVQD